MKSKLVVVLTAVAMIVSLIQPATATVVVTCQDLGGGVAQISYDASDEAGVVAGFALNITVDNGATIESIFDYKTGLSTAADPGYGVFPDWVVFVGDPGEVIYGGTPIVDPDSPDTPLPGLGTYGITVAMAAFYNLAVPADAPLVSDTLFKIAIDWNNATTVNVNIALNATRGGIVMQGGAYPNSELLGSTLIPEPATLLLLGLGGLMIRRRRAL